MQNLTLQQSFGVNAFQDATKIVVCKADLPGLTPTANNEGEQLLTGLIVQAHQHFQGSLTSERGYTITSEQGKSLTYDNRELYEKLNIWFWKAYFIKQQIQNYIVHSFVFDAFVKPPFEVGIKLKPDDLNY